LGLQHVESEGAVGGDINSDHPADGNATASKGAAGDGVGGKSIAQAFDAAEVLAGADPKLCNIRNIGFESRRPADVQVDNANAWNGLSLETAPAREPADMMAASAL
jgi:hypothetical protein